uniref:Uncharacterized protein n=1 Tax=Romanomermis culicivorax TaxID=13658 RepID=A0A915HUP1_ROMCU
MEAEETGNANAKTQMHSFTIQILNCLADGVEAKVDKTKAKMEVRPEAKARGDIIEEGLKEAIEVASSSNPINRLEQRAKSPGAPLADSKHRKTY